MSIIVNTLPHIKAFRSLGRSRVLGEVPGILDPMNLNEALSMNFATPRLMCCYWSEGSELQHRLAKKDERMVDKVVHWGVAIDVDRHSPDGKKMPWDNAEQPWEILETLQEKAPELWPSYFYSTKNGVRLIYVLTRKVTTPDIESVIAGLHERLTDAGIETDPATKDWTRFFVLPFVTKESGEKLWENETIFCEEFDRQLDPDILLQAVREFSPCVIDGDRPSDVASDRLLWGDNGKQTPACRRARQLLETNSFAIYLFAGAACDFAPGERDSKINKMAWSVVRTLFGKKGMEEIGPEMAYAVMRRGVSRLPRDEDDPDKDWTQALYEKTCRIWEQCVDEMEAQKLTDEEEELQILSGFKQMLQDDDVDIRELMAKSGVETEVAVMKRHLIAVSRNQLHIMGRDGRYSPSPTSRDCLHGTVEQQGLGRFYGLRQFGERINEADIIRDGGFAIQTVRGRLGQKRATVSGLGTDQTALNVPTYNLANIEPLYSNAVDKWLQVLAGVNYDRLVDWISHSQDISRPICALSLTGGPGAGKSFLAELMGCLFGPGSKNNHTIFGQWNIGLRDNPVIHIDEGLAELANMRNIDATFREMITGGNLVLSQRRVDERSFEVYPRMMITANNLEALHKIVAGRDLDDDSHNALAERILHIKVHDEARALVKRKITENWIRGDKIALRHFAFLYATRTKPSKWEGEGRFLVEGERDSTMLQDARFNTPLMEAVQRTLLKAIESCGNAGKGIDIDGPSVISGAAAVRELMMLNSQEFFEVKDKSLRSIGAALKKMANGAEVRKDGRRLHRVPIEHVLKQALESGAQCSRAKEIYLEAYGAASLEALTRKS
jgi:hypothetical protein